MLQKFKFIIGHNKTEDKPGEFAEPEKVIKNIKQRIFAPSERVTDCLQVVSKMDKDGKKYNEYLDVMMNARNKAIREKKERLEREKNIKPKPINEIRFSPDASPSSPKSKGRKNLSFAKLMSSNSPKAHHLLLP